jgi:hypothetical protein
MISPELANHFAEVGRIFGRRRRTRRERILDTVRSIMDTAIGAGLVVLPLFGWVLSCTLAVVWGLRLAGVEDPTGTPHLVGAACGVFVWVLRQLLAAEE